jgi:membrane fusion protein, multidrug efflux system
MDDIPLPAPQPSLRPPSSGRRRSRLSHAWSFLAVALFLAGLAALAWYLPHRNATQRTASPFGRGPGGARNTTTVALAEAKLADIPVRLEALGTVTPLAVATVHPQVSGVLTDVFYKEGQQVKRGELLAAIDPRPFQIALDQANGNLERDQAELASAKVTLDRDNALLKQKLIAQQNVDTQLATVQQLEGAVATDRAGVGAAQLNLSYSKVTSPIDGRVGLRTVDVGNYVSTTGAVGIATITTVMPIDVVFTLPADTVTKIQQRLGAGATLPTTVLDRTRTSVLGQGQFLTLDNQIDATTGTIRAKARFANEDAALFPSQFVNVQLQIDVIHDAVTVPAAAIRHGPNGDYVYVVDAEQVATMRNVTVGPASDEAVSIATGLNAGERVVTEGGDRLTDGTRVRLPDAAAPAGAPSDNNAPGSDRRQYRRNGGQGGGNFGGGNRGGGNGGAPGNGGSPGGGNGGASGGSPTGNGGGANGNAPAGGPGAGQGNR